MLECVSCRALCALESTEGSRILYLGAPITWQVRHDIRGVQGVEERAPARVGRIEDEPRVILQHERRTVRRSGPFGRRPFL